MIFLLQSHTFLIRSLLKQITEECVCKKKITQLPANISLKDMSDAENNSLRSAGQRKVKLEYHNHNNCNFPII